jgi:Eco57I restriction-modification methylase
MPLHRSRSKKYLDSFDFESLFIEELGWDTSNAVSIDLAVGAVNMSVQPVAEKRGFTVFHCEVVDMPDRAMSMKFDRQLTEFSRSHLLIFSCQSKSEQVWMWVRQEKGKPLTPRFERYHTGHSGEILLQKLEALVIAFEDEEKLTLPEVNQRVKKAFDVEKVTKKFFKQFEEEHKAFLAFISGIEAECDQTWYASLMLNRLMFIYFIQKKRFLDGNSDYLRDRLNICQAQKGTDEFYSFYRVFLLRLFHEGLGKSGREPDLEKLVGKVPYLNGGLFDVHQLEEKYTTIQIPDEAFTKVFDFFDEYQWHLDDRPLRQDNEINPDVLGYIFEKYINQKEIGAYYTKEDITEYISKNTIIPFLFDAAVKECAVAFQPDGAVWALLRENPDRYIYKAVRKGVDQALPAKIEAGITVVKQREDWNRIATAEYALPTETWREHVARRQRYFDIHGKLANGEISSINDLITYNLDIRQFAQDVISSCEGSDLLRAFYQAISQVSVLDPTCGSGAFLFAALNILEPLYTGCLERMQGFVDDGDTLKALKGKDKGSYEDFRPILAEVANHPNRRYFILKSIILNNLYGVDIMEEATEICKLRLFLKLVSQVEVQTNLPNLGLEPLPDIDFNIRAGNTLIGYVKLDEITKAIFSDGYLGAKSKTNFKEGSEGQGNLLRINQSKEVLHKFGVVDAAFKYFRKVQTVDGISSQEFKLAKKGLQCKLEDLNNELNYYLAREYNINIKDKSALDKWEIDQQPFHWFVNFYNIINDGGFDVIIGNPPYIENKEVKKYKFKGYVCESAGNLYALVMERCFYLGKNSTYQGYIVPVSSISTDRYQPLQKLILSRNAYISSFDDRPSKLFEGLEHIRLTIHLLGKSLAAPKIFSTQYHKWSTSERNILFDCINYTENSLCFLKGTVHKFSSELEFSIASKISMQSKLQSFYDKASSEKIFYSRKVGYFLQILDFEPKVLDGQGNLRPPSEFKELKFSNDDYAKIALCCLNSNLFYWFITMCSDCRHVNKREIDFFPVDLPLLQLKKEGKALLKLAQKLMQDINDKSEERVMRFKHDTLTIQCIFPVKSKSIIDEIDRVIAQHYGFTDEELDFIINYDIKYRMGRDNSET